jgi:hypothetical protein
MTTPGLLRWWDGSRWTEHTAPVAAPYAAVVTRPLVPPDRPIYGPFIWAIVVLPLLSSLLLLAWQPDFTGVTRVTTGSAAVPTVISVNILGPAYYLLLGSAWVIWGLIVFLAFRDRVWLQRQGVSSPFHWAFAFLGGLIYVIGRSIIVRRVAAPRGLAPIWATVGVVIVGFGITGVWIALFTTRLLAELPSISSS